jgi:hypothetical protein
MGYYGMLTVVFVVLIFSIVVQGSTLFSDTFFVIAYAIMAIVLVMGTKYKPSSKPTLAMGMILLLSVGFLSTQSVIELFTNPTTTTFFKLAIVFSLDACALFFLHYGRKFKKEEEILKSKRLGPYDVKGEYPKEEK